MEYYVSEGDEVHTSRVVYVCKNGRLQSVPTAAAFEPQALLGALCRYTGVAVEDVRSKSRRSVLADVRRIFCYVCSEQGVSDRDIASYINRDRSLVWAAVRRCNDIMSVDRQYRQRVENFLSTI